MRSSKFCSLVVYCLMGLAVARAGNAKAGAIHGVVKDANGALDGVTVVATSPSLQGTHTEITDDDGAYTLAGLPPGTYEVVFYYADTKLRRQNVVVQVGKTTPLNVKLDTSKSASEVVIKERSATIDVSNTKQGITITQDYTKNIPPRSRDYSGVLTVAAGSQGDDLGVTFSGATSTENVYVIDGINVTSTEGYNHYRPNPTVDVGEDRLSTFAIDVDTASYTLARRKILAGADVPAEAVRVEEFVNYFKYQYEGPSGDAPFAVHMEAAPSPFVSGRHLLRIGVQGRRIAKADRKKAHLVFLVDVSGSMSSEDRLGLAQYSLRLLTNNLNDGDTVALVTYAGSTRVVLEPTGMRDRARILSAIDDLSAGGSTAMGSGVDLAYQLAVRQVARDAETRVIVLSDGDANVGNTTHEEILRSIQGYVSEGVTLSTIGFGVGNYKDGLMEQLANKGNGNNFYIDSPSQAKRVFQEQLGGTLQVIAKDVKIQVDFNPDAVSQYRLIGYENRDIADRDFREDKVDAGEIGAGHAVTAVYEVELTPAGDEQLATVRIRAKPPGREKAIETSYRFASDRLRASFDDASADFRLAVAATGFAEILRRSPESACWTLGRVRRIADAAAGDAEDRRELVSLIDKARVESARGDDGVVSCGAWPSYEPRHGSATPPAAFDIGLGVRASRVDGSGAADQTQGMSALLRFRSTARPLELELEVGHDTYADSERTDTRLGASLYVGLGRLGEVKPFGVVGAGVTLIDLDNSPMEGSLSLYVEAGGGLAWPVTKRFSLSGDLRWVGRNLNANTTGATPRAIGGAPSDASALELGFAVILYF